MAINPCIPSIRMTTPSSKKTTPLTIFTQAEFLAIHFETARVLKATPTKSTRLSKDQAKDT